MLYNALAIYVSTYSVFAIMFLFVYYFCKWEMGIIRFNNVINLEFAGKKRTVLFAVYSYSVIFAWLALAAPWLDLFTFRWFTHFQDHGIMTYFGLMEGKTADTYFLVMFLNILAVKAALNLGEAAMLFSNNRVKLVPTHLGMVWLRE